MKRWIMLAVIVGMIGFLSPVARTEVYMDFDFPDGIVWQVGGFEVYDVMQRGQVIGQARVEYSPLTMLDQPAVRFTWNETWTDENDIEHETQIDTKMLQSNLRAVLSSRIEIIDSEEWIYEGNFSGDNLAVGYYLPGEAERQEYSVNRPGRILDAAVLPFLLRNIPFEQGNFVTMTVLDTSRQQFFTPIATVSGSQLVQTLATQYDCWTVDVSTPTGGFTAWYTKSDKHYLVRIRYADREIVLNHHS